MADDMSFDELVRRAVQRAEIISFSTLVHQTSNVALWGDIEVPGDECTPRSQRIKDVVRGLLASGVIHELHVRLPRRGLRAYLVPPGTTFVAVGSVAADGKMTSEAEKAE